jgi:hypothetical protein
MHPLYYIPVLPIANRLKCQGIALLILGLPQADAGHKALPDVIEAIKKPVRSERYIRP